MPQTTRPRGPLAALAAVAAAAFALSACSTDPAPATPSTSAPTTTTGTPSTSAAASSSATPSSPAPQGSETAATATAALAKVLTDQAAAATVTGADGQARREAVYAGEALAAATARTKLISTYDETKKADLALNPADAVVLGVSRGSGYPRQIVAKSATAKSSSFTLLLLSAADAASGYRIVHQATILPGAIVGRFDPIAVGSPSAADGAGLAVTPDALLQAYAAHLAYPAPASSGALPFTDDAFAISLRKNIAGSASALGQAVTLRQQHTPVRIAGALRTSGTSGALVFGIIERKDTLTEKTDGSLQVSEVFRVLSGKSTITKQAVLTSVEFVVWQVPVSGLAGTMAAGDQVTSASGS